MKLPLFLRHLDAFSRFHQLTFTCGWVALLVMSLPHTGSGQVTNITSGKVIKWDQPPVLAVPTNVFYGWNEKSVIGNQIAADDWVCTTTNPVVKIRWWGSFIGWNSSDATPVLPFDFRIHFWTDQPSGPGNPFSHPQQAVWQIVSTNFTWQCAGQDYDPRTGTFETCFLFEMTLNPQEWFFQQPLTGTNIYWISIAGDYPTTGNPPFPFGWKTRPRNPSSTAPDSAVDIFNPNNPVPGSLFISGTPISYAALTNQWDLAFELVTFGTTSTRSSKWEQVPDLTTSGMDVNATQPGQVPPFQPPYLLADDFLCTSPGMITNITIWGSWLNDILPQNAAGGPPDPNNVTFILSFHDDIPASQSPTGNSMPGAPLWFRSFGPGTFIHSVLASNIQEGWLTPPGAYIPPPADTVCHQYDFPLGQDGFFQQGTPTSNRVYWLDVQAIPASGGSANAVFGWKSCPTNWNDAAVWVNASEGFAGVWNKLVYPPPHPRSGTNVGLAFRLNTASSIVTTQFVKWSQPPVVAANPGNWYNGWNEPSVDGGGIWNNILLTNIVADDWLCTNARPVTDIHWWGSFLGWATNNLPPGPLMGFHFAIWTDVPTNNPNAPFSHPGVVLWENRVLVGDANLNINWVGWDLDPRDPCLADIESCFKFDYSIPGTNNWFFQQPGTNIYWLSISAMYPAGIPIQYPFGWKTRPHNPVPPDDAVRIFNPLGPALPPGTPFGFGQPIEFPVGSGISWDMAFRLTSCQQAPLTNIVFTNIVVTNIIPLSQRVVTIKWSNSQAGSVYQFQEILALTNQPVNPWVDVGSPIVGPANTAIFTNTLDIQHFYRIRYPDLCP